jgi:P-type Ca2+ transporter type 2C
VFNWFAYRRCVLCIIEIEWDNNMTEITGGLCAAEVETRRRADGYNELPRVGRRTVVRISLEVIREPMLALLLGGGVIYLVLGDVTDALILLAFAAISVVITVIQESRTERVLEALRDLTSPRALVIRDGTRQRIASREVVCGDLLVLAEGERVVADAVLLQCHDVQTDESLLTGESVPVRKVAQAEDVAGQLSQPGGDDQPFVFAGSLVVRGAAIGHVTATGIRSEIGKIGQSLNAIATESPRLQSEIKMLVRMFAIVGGSVSVLAVVLYGTLRGGWLDAVLAGIALGMSMLPEELPVVLTVFMAMGAWRMSQARVLTRRASAIETLGSATVLCTDKTGTLTENRMSIARLCLSDGKVFQIGDDANVEIPDGFRELVRIGTLASAPTPTDPMDKAFRRLHVQSTSLPQLLLHSYGLRPELLAMSNVWQVDGTSQVHIVAAKGAPEAIAALCHLDDVEIAELKCAADLMAADGLRVLGVATASLIGVAWPDSQHDFTFSFVGLVGIADPIRPTVAAAVRDCRTAGIRVIMITGDYPATALSIARQAGVTMSTDANDVVTGESMTVMEDEELITCVRSATVFARTMSAHKLRIVNALKANGDVVAMTGDGVNDAPSLKSAHIGIAMGQRGTEVAREASAIVLLNDDFGSIVEATRLGRRIYDNLRKAVSFIFAVHVPIAGLALLPLLFGFPLLLGPMHIALLEMVIDPVCSLVFEAERAEDNVMRRPPRAPSEPLFSRQMILWSLSQGGFAFALTAIIFVVGLRRGIAEAELRALTFVALVTTIVALIFVNLSFGASASVAVHPPNRALRWVLGAIAVAISVSVLLPFSRDLLRFGALTWPDVIVAIGTGAVTLMSLQLAKRRLSKRLSWSPVKLSISSYRTG